MEIKMDRRVKKTKQALQNAYIDLTEKYRSDEITVLMIAQYADLNRATFYAHYSNKEEFLKESLCELLEGFRIAILAPFEDSSQINVNSLAPTTIQIFDYIEKNKRIFYAMYTSHADFEKLMKEFFYEVFTTDIILEMHSNLGEIRYEMFLHYQSNATLGLIFFWIQGDFQYTAQYMMEQLTIFSNTQVLNLRKSQ